MKIKIVLSIYNSARDNSGNCYWAFNALDPNTGKRVSGTISGGESNIRAAVVDGLGFEWAQSSITVSEIPKRVFNKRFQGYSYAGCAPREIARFIKQGLGWKIRKERFACIKADETLKPGSGYCHYFKGNKGSFYRVGFNCRLTGTARINVEDGDFQRHGALWERKETEENFKKSL